MRHLTRIERTSKAHPIRRSRRFISGPLRLTFVPESEDGGRKLQWSVAFIAFSGAADRSGSVSLYGANHG
jgi:hypothetical protein